MGEKPLTLSIPLPLDDASEDVAKIWHVFSKCKSSLQEGRRLENLSWRLWHQTAFHPLPPAEGSSTSLIHHNDTLSDPEGGCSDSSLSDGSPSSTYRHRRSPSLHARNSTESASSAPPATFKPRDGSVGPAPTRMSPSSLQTLIHKVLEPAELEMPRLRTSALAKSSQIRESGSEMHVEPPIAHVPPVPEPPDTIPMGKPRGERPVEEDAELASTSMRSRHSEGSNASSSRGPARRTVHHAHMPGQGHSRSRNTAAALRRDLSERALAHRASDQLAPLAPVAPARPALPRGTSGEKQVKTVRIVEGPSPEMVRTPSRERPESGHHRRSSSNASMRSNLERITSHSNANLTSLEPQSITKGFGAGSVTSLASMSPVSAGPFLGASPAKQSSLRKSFILHPSSPPNREVDPQYSRAPKEVGRNKMFFVGSEHAEELDGDSSSGWGSDPEEVEAPSSSIGKGKSDAPKMKNLAPPSHATRFSEEKTEASMFAKRPVRSAADLASAASMGDMTRTASQGLLTALFSTDPYALARQSQRPADRAAALMPSRSAVSLPARRLGGPPADVELSDDEDEEPAPADAIAVPKAYNISNAAARAVVQPPIQLSASQTRRNMLTTELSESLRRNLLWERQSQPSARDRRVVDRRAASAAKQLMGNPSAGAAPASVAIDTANYFANQYHRQGW